MNYLVVEAISTVSREGEDMTEKGLPTLRAEVIQELIGLEALVDCVISVHYLGKISKAFYNEVLYDEYFSFGLKVRILSKILSSEGKEGEDQIRVLQRLNNIRNIFAHCGATWYAADSGESFVPNPKKPDQGLDFDALRAEFNGALPAVRDYLLLKAVEKGAEIKINRDGTWEDVHT